MSVDTYYSLLGVPETATQADIKAAYRNLIKQVHPDTLAGLAPYLRGIAEDRTKEMTEAYSVLSDLGKRDQYDRQLAEYRQQTIPTTPPPTPPESSRAAQPQASKRSRYDWKLLRRWAGTHPWIACSLGILTILGIVSLFRNATATVPSKSNAIVVADDASQSAPDIAPVVPANSGHAIDGIYFGTVHNKTAGLSASFRVLFQQKGGGILAGCVDAKPPLYESGLLHGAIRGSHIEFVVNSIRYQGDLRSRKITGTYIFSRNEGGQELGDFHLARKMGAYPEGTSEQVRS